MNESDFWGKIKANVKIDYLKRLENKIEPGWPDVFYMHKTYNGFIELKCEEDLPMKIDFEPAQPLWLDEYFRKGGDCWVWLYVVKTKRIYIWTGKEAMNLNKRGGPRFIEPFLMVKDNPIGWQEIYDEIFKTMNQMEQSHL